jgi:hypothetical protein
MIVDLASGETYGQILYRDAADVVLGTLDFGASQMRESHLPAAAFGQVVDVEGIGRGALARFQILDVDAGAAEDLFQQRRDALAAYAAANGDSISVHSQDDRRGGLSTLTQWRRRIFGDPDQPR